MSTLDVSNQIMGGGRVLANGYLEDAPMLPRFVLISELHFCPAFLLLLRLCFCNL